MEEKKHPIFEEEQSVGKVCEPVASAVETTEITMTDDLDYAHVVNSVLQITPDIEEEIAEVERGETVSMSEFKSMFSKWLD